MIADAPTPRRITVETLILRRHDGELAELDVCATTPGQPLPRGFTSIELPVGCTGHTVTLGVRLQL